MKITERLRRECDTTWEKIINHRFIIELYEGFLPLEKFRFYILQDYNYLAGLVRALALTASKSDFMLAADILSIAQEESDTELKNYEKILNGLGLTIEEAIDTERSMITTAYSDFLISSAHKGNSCEGLAAVLPCFWSYVEISERNKNRLERNENELYREWARAYLPENAPEIARKIREIIDTSDTRYGDVKEIFADASTYELRFWDMAYDKKI